jgi:hypothetical protein
MSMGFRAESTNTSGVITVAGVDQVVINNAGNVTATTFTGALVGNASTATALSTTTGAAPVYGVRAWVNFDGLRNESGGSDTATTNRFIRGNGNVSSVLRNGAGNYTITFATAMPDANYSWSFGGDSSGGRVNTYGVASTAGSYGVFVPTASIFRVQFMDDQSAYVDAQYACVTFFR